MARFIRQRYILDDDPAALLVAGDLNATPASDPYRILTTADDDFIDSASGQVDAGRPTWRLGPFRRRLDYIFCHRHLQITAHRTLGEDLQRPAISDHRAIVVDCARWP